MSLNSLQSMFGPGCIFTHFHVNYMHLQLLFKIPLTKKINISLCSISIIMQVCEAEREVESL